MKITKTKLKEIIKEELVQALNEQTINEQDEPYDPRRPVDKPYTDYGTGADKRFAYVLNGRLNKGMDSKRLQRVDLSIIRSRASLTRRLSGSSFNRVRPNCK